MKELLRRLNSDSGYSLPEVLVAILILAIAIIPMVGMFDAGLRAATLGGNYDKARALANKQLELSKSLPYETVRDNFPPPGPTSMTGGTYTSPAQTDTDFPGFTYVVRKTYMNGNLNPDPDSKTRMEIEITVSWNGGSNSYTTTGLVALGTP